MQLGSRPAFLSVIVAVARHASDLRACLAALMLSDLPHDAWELIVVIDGSDETLFRTAAEHAKVVARLPGGPRGLAYANNRGAEFARGDYLILVDADVAVLPATIRELRDALDGDPTVGAVSASFERDPASRSSITEYRVWQQHHLTEAGAGETDAVSMCCSAIRRSAFLDAGMLNEWRVGQPRTDGVELGQRLRALGHRVMIDPEIRALDRRPWTLRSLVVAELIDHGVAQPDDIESPLALPSSGLVATRIRDAITSGTLFTAAALIAAAAVYREARLSSVAAALIVVGIVSMAPFATTVVRLRGIWALPGFFVTHALVATIGAISRFAVTVRRQLIGEPRPKPAIEALGEMGVVTWPPLPSRRTVRVAPMRHEA